MNFADMKNNIATEGDFNAQKQKIQDEAEMGEKAAAIAAKLPINPETAIEGYMLWRQIKQGVKDYALPVLIVGFSVAGAIVTYQLYQKKEKEA